MNWPPCRGSSSSGSPSVTQDHRAKDRHSEHRNKQWLPCFPGRACLLLWNCHWRCCPEVLPSSSSLGRHSPWEPPSSTWLTAYEQWHTSNAANGTGGPSLPVHHHRELSTHLSKLCPQSTWTPDLSSQPPPPQVHSGLKTLQQGEESSVTRLCYVAALKGEQGILAAWPGTFSQRNQPKSG